jgi:hypothetical protein
MDDMNPKQFGRMLAACAAGTAFVIYGLTMARTVTWLHNGADSGDLVTAAFTFGVPHPPGYPLYTLVAALFARFPLGEPAFGVALFSALAAAGAIYLLARAGDALLQTLAVSKTARVFTQFIPPLAALGFAFAPMLWSQAIIPEVYALNLFFVALLLWACVSTHPRRVEIAALALGLGAAHHLSILLLAPGAWILLQPKRQDARALWWFVLPLLAYAYLPLVSLGNPPVKWGDPITLERFWWLVSAAQYRSYLFDLSAADVFSRVAFSARALLDQFTVVGLAFVLWGAIQLAMTRARVFVGLLVMFVPMVLYAVVYASRDSFLYLLPALAIALLWAVYGATSLLQMTGERIWLQGALILLLAALPIFNLVTQYAAMDVSRDRAAFEYARANFQGLPDDAVLFADGDEALFALWYYRHAFATHNPRAVLVSQGLLQYDWYYDSLRRTMSEVQFKSPQEVADAPSRVQEIIRVAFAEGRAVCFTDSSPLHPGFEYEARGAVQCVVGER